MELEMVKVVSSNIKSVGYSESTRTLVVEFKGGNLYEYYEVEEDEYQTLINASSVGSIFHKLIKNNKSFNRL